MSYYCINLHIILILLCHYFQGGRVQEGKSACDPHDTVVIFTFMRH